MVHCCVPGCKNTHHHKSKKEEWQIDSRNYSLHDLPGEDRLEVRELWVMAINRSTLPKDVAVCSDHFTEDCFDEKWEEYKRKYGPTKVKRKLKLDAVPTVFPGRVFYHEKVQQIREDWKNKVLQKRLEYERLRLEKEYRDRFKATQTECQCKCRCKLRKKHFGQQVNFQFKFMEDVGVQFPKDLTETVKDDHSYTQGGKKKNKSNASSSTFTSTATSSTNISNNSDVSIQTENNNNLPLDAGVESSNARLESSSCAHVDGNDVGEEINTPNIDFECHRTSSAAVVIVPLQPQGIQHSKEQHNMSFQMKRKTAATSGSNYYENCHEKRIKFPDEDEGNGDELQLKPPPPS